MKIKMKIYKIIIVISVLLSGCNSNLRLVSHCVDCVEEFNETKESLQMLYNIEYYSGRPLCPCFSTDYETLEKRFGIEIFPNFEKMFEIDTLNFYFTENEFKICYILNHNEKSYELILNNLDDISIRNEDITMKLLESMCKVGIDKETLKVAVKKYAFDILTAQKKIGAYWFHGYSNYIEFNCKAGSKRLIYFEGELASLALNTNYLFRIVNNWYLYDNPKEHSRKYYKIINRKKKKYGW